MPSDTILTVQIENQEIPCLISQLVQNGQVLDHPEVHQRQEIPVVEQDTCLNLIIQPTPQNPSPSDPNAPMTHMHTLSPLSERASLIEQSMIHGFQQVHFSYHCQSYVDFEFQTGSDATWVAELERAEAESTMPLSAVEHQHLLAFGLDRMGTLRPQAIVSDTHVH